jgi:hypothetical protein
MEALLPHLTQQVVGIIGNRLRGQLASLEILTDRQIA